MIKSTPLFIANFRNYNAADPMLYKHISFDDVFISLNFMTSSMNISIRNFLAHYIYKLKN